MKNDVLYISNGFVEDCNGRWINLSKILMFFVKGSSICYTFKMGLDYELLMECKSNEDARAILMAGFLYQGKG